MNGLFESIRFDSFRLLRTSLVWFGSVGIVVERQSIEEWHYAKEKGNGNRIKNEAESSTRYIVRVWLCAGLNGVWVDWS